MAEQLNLLDELSDSEIEFKINKGYADRYSKWRKKEELQKYKDLLKEEDSESSSESEEEPPEFDEEYLRALSLIKSKDPRIYDENFVLFKNKEIKKKPKTVKQKPLYMKDYERNLVLVKGGKFSDEDDENIPAKGPTYSEEQEELKKSFKAAVSDSDTDDDNLLMVRDKTKKEEKEEEEDYIKWLKGEEVDMSEDRKKDLAFLRKFWNDPNLDEDEKFLRDFILNRNYREKDEDEILAYDEITSGALSEDERTLEEQEKFEHKYNFRFEEPDEDFIKRYPRTVGNSFRKTDNRRKQKREEKAERKQQEKQQRKEELKRLKALKRKEIEEKFLKLKEVSGQEELNLNESDIESDFDPDKHDQKMREMFNDDYYKNEEDQKPEFPYDEELDSENWNVWSRDKTVERVNNDETESLSNDETYSDSITKPSIKEQFEKEMINATQPKKKLRKKSLFAKVISQPKPIYDPDGKSFDEYLDEYYKLDYEDVIGDMPVRYKYRKVIPNDFGLTVDEILAAKDKELNRWCSVKKTCQYRNDEEELYDVQAYKKKSQNVHTKKKILPSVYAPEENNGYTTQPNTGKKGKHVPDSSISSVNSEDSCKKEYTSIDVNNKQELNLDSLLLHDLKKKSKKIKKDLKQDDLKSLETEYDLDAACSRSNLKSGYESKKRFLPDSPSLKDCFNSKLSEKKRKVDNELPVDSTCRILSTEDILSVSKHYKKEKQIEMSDASCNLDSHTVSEETTKIRKKKKMCKNLNEDLKSIPTSSGKCNISDVHLNKFSNKTQMKHIPDDQSFLPESPSLKDCFNSELSKKKRKVDNELPVDSACKVLNNGDILSASKHSIKVNQTEMSDASCSNLDSYAVSEETTKKKKKKKKHKNQNKDLDSILPNSRKCNISEVHLNKFSNKTRMKHFPDDKRLGLSEERLAAYGINPKKFKNKVIYSKK